MDLAFTSISVDRTERSATVIFSAHPHTSGAGEWPFERAGVCELPRLLEKDLARIGIAREERPIRGDSANPRSPARENPHGTGAYAPDGEIPGRRGRVVPSESLAEGTSCSGRAQRRRGCVAHNGNTRRDNEDENEDEGGCEEHLRERQCVERSTSEIAKQRAEHRKVDESDQTREGEARISLTPRSLSSGEGRSRTMLGCGGSGRRTVICSQCAAVKGGESTTSTTSSMSERAMTTDSRHGVTFIAQSTAPPNDARTGTIAGRLVGNARHRRLLGPEPSRLQILRPPRSTIAGDEFGPHKSR